MLFKAIYPDLNWRDPGMSLKHQICAMALLLCLVLPVVALAQEGAPEEAAEPAGTDTAPAVEEADATPGDSPSEVRHNVMMLIPPSNFYPEYIADPMRAQSAITFLYIDHSEIPNTGNTRFCLRLGGRWGLLRIHPEGEPDSGLQLDFEGGFFGHFDMDYSLDNIGWDGIFGLLLSWKPRPDLGFRIGTLHDSPHVGDEYAERTGRKRIGSTREEVIAGASWNFTPQWRVYTEGGYGYNLENFQDPWRLQAGVEYLSERRFWKGRILWYAALDLRAYEENNWNVRSTAQLGFILPTGRGTSRYRLAIEFCDGRSALSEYYFRKERYLGVGWYFDF